MAKTIAMATATAPMTSPSTAPSTASSNSESILARLKTATRAEHDAIEATLDFLGPDLDRLAYQQRLARLFTFYQPLEPLLATAADWAHWGIDFDARRKTAHLAADLQWLGHGAVASLPRCAALPPLPGAAAAFGCLYVLEGATLGGRIIARHLAGTLGFSADNGASYFSAYGDRAGSMWKAFQAAMTAFAEQSQDSDAIVASAVATFDALRLWSSAVEQSGSGL